MRSAPSLSRRWVLLIAVMSPALLGSQFTCAVVSNPSVVTARIVQLEPTTPRVGDVVQATGSGTGHPPLQFAWDFGDGIGSAGSQAAHVYTTPGSYRVTLTVRDVTGSAGSDSSQVIVSARVSPSATLILVSDTVTSQPIVFVALQLEENASARTYTYIWRFSDGRAATGTEVAEIFPAAGLYLASVTVTNDLGEIAVAQFAFQVVDAAG